MALKTINECKQKHENWFAPLGSARFHLRRRRGLVGIVLSVFQFSPPLSPLSEKQHLHATSAASRKQQHNLQVNKKRLLARWNKRSSLRKKLETKPGLHMWNKYMFMVVIKILCSVIIKSNLLFFFRRNLALVLCPHGHFYCYRN